MASLFNMPRPRGSRNEDNLLGINGDIGMTDSSFQGMGRAPVNELWAGRYSAAIDDEEFDKAVELGKLARTAALDAKEGYMQVPEFQKPAAEDEWLSDARQYITDQSGLDLYPGHMRADEESPIFMSEFSDEGSLLREGYMDALNEASAKGDGVYLGDVFHHPEFYRHYPEAQLLPVFTDSDMEENHRGSYYRPDEGLPMGAMALNPAILDDEKNRETLLHELQHFIQSAEGWESGGMGGTEGGIKYAENLLGSAATHPDSPEAGRLSDAVTGMYNASEEIMPFMKEQEVGSKLGHTAYEALTGEQLARDATYRDKNGGQVENYYLGPTDRSGYANWNPTNASFKPMAAMPAIRQAMMEEGLLGPMLDIDGNTVKHETVDPYVEKYMQALMTK